MQTINNLAISQLFSSPLATDQGDRRINSKTGVRTLTGSNGEPNVQSSAGATSNDVRTSSFRCSCHIESVFILEGRNPDSASAHDRE